jgi:hypothetical protein
MRLAIAKTCSSSESTWATFLAAIFRRTYKSDPVGPRQALHRYVGHIRTRCISCIGYKLRVNTLLSPMGLSYWLQLSIPLGVYVKTEQMGVCAAKSICV